MNKRFVVYRVQNAEKWIPVELFHSEEGARMAARSMSVETPGMMFIVFDNADWKECGRYSTDVKAAKSRTVVG